MKSRPQPNDDLLLSLELFCSTVCLGCGCWHLKKFMCWHTLGKHRQGERGKTGKRDRVAKLHGSFTCYHSDIM